jgi:hypothetical protein|tara:strand:+ start:2592 stop:2816 length:225 start_codon:yes stop_codon:yes gene_type:complete
VGKKIVEYLYIIFNCWRFGIFAAIFVLWFSAMYTEATHYAVFYIALTMFKLELDKLVETRYTSRQEMEEDLDED